MSSQETIELPAPQVPPLPNPAGKWQREYEAFQQLLPELLTTHAGQYVAIHEGRVVDSGPDDLELAMRFFRQYGNVALHIGSVTTAPEPVIRIPHYRLLKSNVS